jgi:hypothetical protein
MSYTLSAPSPAFGLIGVASGNFSITWGTSNPSSAIIFTPASTSHGVFNPTTVTVPAGATGAALTVTFTWMPEEYGEALITTTNTGGSADPAGVAYTCNPFSTYGTDADGYTVLKNVSGVQKTFSFLGVRGVTLLANEEYSFPGTILAPPYGLYRSRDYLDYMRALSKGYLVVVSSPALFVKDTSTKQVKKVILTNSILGTADPSWGAFVDGM